MSDQYSSGHNPAQGPPAGGPPAGGPPRGGPLRSVNPYLPAQPEAPSNPGQAPMDGHPAAEPPGATGGPPSRTQAKPPQGTFGILLAMIPKILESIRRGETNEALAAPFAAGRQINSKHGPWLFSCAALSLAVGLTITLGKIATGMFGMGISEWASTVSAPGLLLRFFGSALLTAALFMLRVLTVRWTFATRQIPLGAAGAGNIVATAWHAYGAFWAVMLPLALLPGITSSVLQLMVGGLLAVVVVIVAETLIYAGIARAVPAGKPDPLIPHALLTLVWALLFGIVLGIIGLIAAAMVFDAFMSSFGGFF